MMSRTLGRSFRRVIPVIHFTLTPQPFAFLAVLASFCFHRENNDSKSDFRATKVSQFGTRSQL